MRDKMLDVMSKMLAKRDATDPIVKMKDWIAQNVKGKTFADVGGIGVNSVNERVTLASKSGALSSTMIDIRPSNYYEWDIFHAKCKDAGVQTYHCIDCADITDPNFFARAGAYDFVHSTGIVYHLPNPVWGVQNLTKIVKEYLIINTVIIPSVVETEHGSLEFRGNTALFMPGLSPAERLILNSYYLNKFKAANMTLDYMAPKLDAVNPDCPWFDEHGNTTCWPYWWLFTENSFISLVKMMGFEILDAALWEDHALALLTKRIR